MISKLTRILLYFLIVGVALGVVYLNQDDVTVRYGLENQFSLMGGVVYLLCFSLGLISSLIFWVMSGVKGYFRERQFRIKEDKQKQFYDSFLFARSLQSTGQLLRASSMWQKLIKKDPTNIIARVELSKTLEEGGDLREALKVLDKARETDPTNVEVLLQAANLNEQLGNKTAALDNLALAIYQDPSAFAVGEARNLSLELGRIDDALEYQEKFESVGGEPNSDESLELRYIALKRDYDSKLARRDELSDKEVKALEKARTSAIRSFIKHQPHFLPAVLELVEELESQQQRDEAAELLLASAKENKAAFLWRKAIDLWLAHQDGEKALSAARTALRNASRANDRYLARLDLARVNLLVSKPEDALNELEGISELDQSEDSSLRNNYLALMGYCLNQLGRYQDAAKVWKRLLEPPDSSGRTLLLPLDNPNIDESAIYYPALRDVSANDNS